MNTPLLFGQFKKSFSEFWTARDARERLILTLAVVVTTLALIYILLIAPALSGRVQLDKNLLELRQQVAEMQALAKVATALSKAPAQPLAGNSAALPATMTQENIEAALARNGLKPKSVMLNGGIVKVQLVSASFSGMLNWLDEMQKNVQLTVADANIVALAQPDFVDATLTLRRQERE